MNRESQNNALFRLIAEEKDEKAAIQKAEKLVQAGASLSARAPNAIKNTPLIQAMIADKKELARALIFIAIAHEPKSLDLQDQQPDCCNNALILAIKKGWTDIALQLIEANANIHNCACEKFSPLHYACLLRQDDVIQALVKKGAKLDVRNVHGATPLDYYLYVEDELDQLVTFRQYAPNKYAVAANPDRIPDLRHAVHFDGLNQRKIQPNPAIIQLLGNKTQLSNPFAQHLHKIRETNLDERLSQLPYRAPCNDFERRILIEFDKLLAKKLFELEQPEFHPILLKWRYENHESLNRLLPKDRINEENKFKMALASQKAKEEFMVKYFNKQFQKLTEILDAVQPNTDVIITIGAYPDSEDPNSWEQHIKFDDKRTRFNINIDPIFASQRIPDSKNNVHLSFEFNKTIAEMLDPYIKNILKEERNNLAICYFCSPAFSEDVAFILKENLVHYRDPCQGTGNLIFLHGYMTAAPVFWPTKNTVIDEVSRIEALRSHVANPVEERKDLEQKETYIHGAWRFIFDNDMWKGWVDRTVDLDSYFRKKFAEHPLIYYPAGFCFLYQHPQLSSLDKAQRMIRTESADRERIQKLKNLFDLQFPECKHPELKKIQKLFEQKNEAAVSPEILVGALIALRDKNMPSAQIPSKKMPEIIIKLDAVINEFMKYLESEGVPQQLHDQLKKDWLKLYNEKNPQKQPGLRQ